jgi:hypothetical protein
MTTVKFENLAFLERCAGRLLKFLLKFKYFKTYKNKNRLIKIAGFIDSIIGKFSNKPAVLVNLDKEYLQKTAGIVKIDRFTGV